MAPIHPMYFVVSSDSNSSPSGSKAGSAGSNSSSSSSGSSSSTTSAALNRGALPSSPLDSYFPASAGYNARGAASTSGPSSYFEPQARGDMRQHMHHSRHQTLSHQHHRHGRSFPRMLLGNAGYADHADPHSHSHSRASSITSLGSGSSDEGDDDDAGDSSESGDERDAAADQQPPPRPATRPNDLSADSNSRSSKGERSKPASSRTQHPSAPPRISDLFPSSRALRMQASQAIANAEAEAAATGRVATGPYADSLIDNPAPTQPARKKQRLYCPEPNCCGNAPSHPGSIKSVGKTRDIDSSRARELFWKRQMWLMEHRGADGLSHCGSDDEERRGSPHNDEDENEGDGDAAGDKSSKSASASDAAVLRTAGAGLPLARVKRVMKHADDEIKMISHEAPSLLSRLCTVLVADLSMRAGRYALTQGRRTIAPKDLMEVTVGAGEGSGAEWEFLRDVVGEPRRE